MCRRLFHASPRLYPLDHLYDEWVIAFTTDPEAIEKDIKLDYDFKLVGGVEIYSVYPASGSAGTAV